MCALRKQAELSKSSPYQSQRGRCSFFQISICVLLGSTEFRKLWGERVNPIIKIRSFIHPGSGLWFSRNIPPDVALCLELHSGAVAPTVFWTGNAIFWGVGHVCSWKSSFVCSYHESCFWPHSSFLAAKFLFEIEFLKCCCAHQKGLLVPGSLFLISLLQYLLFLGHSCSKAELEENDN